MNRFERWVKAGYKVADIEVFMIPNIHGLGRLDTNLISFENKFLAQPNLVQEEDKALAFSEHLTLSYLWVLGTYEIIRIIDEALKNTDNKEAKKIKHKFARLRIPLAKYEPASYHKKTDSRIAYPVLNLDVGVAWQIAENTIITRRQLSDTFLDFLENFEMDHE